MQKALHQRYGHFRKSLPESDVVFEKCDGWWAVSCPRIPGAYSQGRTKQSAYNNLVSAIADLAKLRREGLIK